MSNRKDFSDIETREQFAKLLEGVISEPEEIKHLESDRIAYWKDQIMVIHNPRDKDSGTALVPKSGHKFFKRIN